MIGAENDPIPGREAEMVAGVPRRVDREHSRHHVPIVDEDIRLEGWIGYPMERKGRCSRPGLKRGGGAQMI